ncbi:MAG: radical SAM protein [Desulfobacterales bacterium]
MDHKTSNTLLSSLSAASPPRVLLVNPPHPEGKGFTREGRCTQEAGVWATQWPPVSLATAAALLEADGRTAEIIDCPAVGMDTPALLRRTAAFGPGWIFVTTGTPTLSADLAAAARLKQAAPAAQVAVFGTHVTADPEAALLFGGIDAVIRGEPEGTIADLCRKTAADRTKAAGISFVDASGEVRHNPDRPWLDPAEIPAPAWHRLDLSPYRLPLKGRLFLIVAPVRGCPYRCTFCTAPQYYGRTLRMRPVKQVADEIEQNVARFDITDYFIWADTFTASRTYVAEFCREIRRRRLRIQWTCNSRVDTVDDEILAVMKEAGCWMISYGIESADQGVLSRSHKNITSAQSARAVAAARRAGLVVSGHFIFGLPGDSIAGMKKTLAFALQLPLDIGQFYAASPFPGTALFGEAREKGWLQADGAGSQSRSAMDLPGLPAETVDAFRRLAFRRFYLRPRVMARLLSLVKPAALPLLAQSVLRFFGWSHLIGRL